MWDTKIVYYMSILFQSQSWSWFIPQYFLYLKHKSTTIICFFLRKFCKHLYFLNEKVSTFYIWNVSTEQCKTQTTFFTNCTSIIFLDEKMNWKMFVRSDSWLLIWMLLKLKATIAGHVFASFWIIRKCSNSDGIVVHLFFLVIKLQKNVFNFGVLTLLVLMCVDRWRCYRYLSSIPRVIFFSSMCYR